MTLFLTSSPCDNDVMKDAHLPFCFFEKNQFLKNIKARWKQNTRCLIISASPYEFEGNSEMASAFCRAFLYHGMIPSQVKLCDARNDYHASELIAESDLIILGGGHVPTQMAFFEKIGLRKLLERYEGIIIGISAGSMNCAKIVYSQPEEPGESIDPEYRRFFPGLGLTSYQILPHYHKVKHNLLDGRRLYEDIIYPDSFDQEFYVLPDSSYILQEKEHTILYGEAYVIRDGKQTLICQDGDFIEL